MKKFLFSLFAAFMCVATVNAQLVGVVVESANDGSVGITPGALGPILCPGGTQPAGTTTYRVYAELQDTDDFLSAMFAIPGGGANPSCYPLTVNTTTSFFNSPIGQANGGGVIEAACGSFPDVYWDSFMTIGREFSDDGGSVGNQWSVDPFSNPFGPASFGNVLGTDGAIFATNGNPNALPTGPNNRVLLGQFTTTGDLSFNINVNVFDGGDGVGGNLQYIAYDVDNTNCPVPGTAIDGQDLGLIFPSAVVDGCTDVTACNYDSAATNDDGSCEFTSCAGCTDATATNYDPTATIDDGSCIIPPANDDCANAIAIVVNDPAISGDNTNSTADGASPACWWGSGVATDIWYSFDYTGGSVTIETFENGGMDDTQIAVYDACGGNELGCNDDVGFPNLMSILTLDCTTLTAGNTYFLQVNGYNGQEGSFDISITGSADGCTDPAALNYDACAVNDDGSCISAVTNDDCANATPLTINDPATTSSNSGASPDGLSGSCWTDGGVENDVWFSFVAAGGTTTIETFAGTNNDTQVSVYDACGGIEVACDDDSGSGFMSLIVADCSIFIPGNTYYIQVDGWDGTEGEFDIAVSNAGVDGCTDPTATNYDACVQNDDGSCSFAGCTDPTALNYDPNASSDDGSCAFPPANDDCANATALTMNGGASAGTNVNATHDGAQMSCASSFGFGEGNDVWFSFVAEGGTTTVTTSDADGSLDDTIMAIYDACGGTEVACNDDIGFPNFFSEISADCSVLIPGTTYYVQVIDYGSNDEGSFFIEVSNSGLEGCTDSAASNYDACAQNDDGSCTFDVLGCTDAGAVNYDPAATIDDGSCIVPGCTDAPTTLTQCYDNDDAISLTFTEANAGDGVLIVINAGTMEGFWDGFAAYDGADNTAPVLVGPSGSFGTDDYAGTILQSTGASITLEWNGDSSVSCGDGSQTEFNYDVYCAAIVSGCTDAGACNYDATAITDDGSCDFSCFGCTDAGAVNYDPAATIDDGTCVFANVNDLPSLATALSLNVANGPGAGCSGLVGEDMSAASVVAPEGQYRQTNPDLWYEFVPFSSGVRIQVQTTDFDALIEVFDEDGNRVDQSNGVGYEDSGFDGTGEIWHGGDLTAGDVYKIRVAPYFGVSGPSLFDICVQTLRDTRCDYGPGPYAVCGTFKADFCYADEYIFNFTSDTDGTTYSSAPQASTFLSLANVSGLQYGDTYTVSIEAVYNLLDIVGNPNVVIVQNDEPCDFVVTEAPVVTMSPDDNATNAGPQFLGNYIETSEFVCGAESYTWTFSPTNGDLPIVYNSGSVSPLLRISDALTESAAGQTFDVTVRPIFANGVEGVDGASEVLAIIGAVTAPNSPIVANDMMNDALRTDVVEAAANIYPNPSTGDVINLNVTDIADDVEVVNVTITDMNGRQVQAVQYTVAGSSLVQTMDVDLAAGLYLVRIQMNDKEITERLSVVK